MRQVAVTMAANTDVTPAGIQAMLKQFAIFDVTQAMIEKRIQRRLEAIQPAQVVSLLKVFNSLKDGMSVVKDWFELGDSSTSAAALPATSVKDIKSRAKQPTSAPAATSGETKAATPATATTEAETDAVAGQTKAPTGETTDPATGEIRREPVDQVQRDDNKPVVTFAEVRDALNKAKEVDALDEAASLISAVGNRAQQKQLNSAYAKRREELVGD